MRKFLGTLALLAIVIAVIGLSRDWFTVQRDRKGSETEVYLRIHRDRIRADTRDAAEVAKEVGENLEKRLAEKSVDRDPAEAEPQDDG